MLRVARILLRDVALAITILVALGIVARYTGLIDRFFIFFPSKEIAQDPSNVGLDFEDVLFKASDGVELHGWLVPGTSDLTLVWFHGNAGNISHRVDNIAEVHERLGASVFIFDYRGYGRSEGTPSEKGTYLDAEAAMSYLRSREDVDENKLVLFGRSLGCAVAAETARANDVYALILESPLTSVQRLAGRVYPWLPGIGRLATTKYDTLSKIKDVRAPVMVIHGDRDEVVPFDMGEEIFAAANAPKRFYAIEGAGHNDTYVVGGPAYFDALKEFLEDPDDQG